MGLCSSKAASGRKGDSSRVVRRSDYSLSRVGGTSLKQIGNVVFFPDQKMPCRSITEPNFGPCRKGEEACEYSHKQTNLTYFLDCLNSAEKTLDVAVFTITCNEIANAIKNAVERGVRVRIITYMNNVDTNGSDIRELNALAKPNNFGYSESK